MKRDGRGKAAGLNGRGPLPGWLALVLAALVLCWPAAVNGGAFYFPDSSYYVRSADAAMVKLTSFRTIWSDRLDLYDRHEPSAIPAQAHAATRPADIDAGREAGKSGENKPLHPVLLGRSIYYGALIYFPMILFGGGGVVVLQALLASGLIRLALVAAAGRGLAGLSAMHLACGLALAATTPLAFFVSMVMPDVFAGFAVASAALLLAAWTRFSPGERLFLAALLVASALTHSSHVLVLLAMFGFAAILKLRSPLVAGPGLLLVALGIGSGLAGERVFAEAVRHQSGAYPIRPPFLTARLIDAGPAYALLREECPQVDLAACRYLDRMPRDSDTFLWSLKPDEGVFSTVAHDAQRRLADEDTRLAMLALLHQPQGVIASSFTSLVKGMTSFEFRIFNAASGSGDGTGDSLVANLPRPIAENVARSRYLAGTMPTRAVEFASTLTAAASAIFLLWLIWVGLARKAANGDRGRTALLAALVLAGVAANAAITGILSKPHSRYNIRIVWVLPLAAGAVAGARLTRHNNRRQDVAAQS